MMKAPQRMPETGRDAKLKRWLNRLRDSVVAAQPIKGKGIRTTHTSGGTIISYTGSTETNSSAGGPAVWS